MTEKSSPQPAQADAREAFEARTQYKSKLLFKRGGSVFAEDVPPGDYVDGIVQRDWLIWQEAWKAATAAIPAPEGAYAAVKTLKALGYTWHGAELWEPPLGQTPRFVLAAPAPQAPADVPLTYGLTFAERIANRLGGHTWASVRADCVAIASEADALLSAHGITQTKEPTNDR